MFRGRRTIETATKARLFSPAVMAAVLVTACVACGADGADGAPGKTGDGELVWGKSVEVDVLDPATSNSAPTWELLSLTYESLVGVDESMSVVPELATAWEQTSPTTYEFELREGVKFSNGRVMTVDDVVGSLNRLIDPELAAFWAGQLGISKVAKSSDSSITVTLVSPRTTFLEALAGTPAAVLPMEELDEGTFDPTKELLGTGPYEVTDHVQGESWTLEGNSHYWQSGLPKVDQLTVRILSDDAARTAALRDGSIDVTTYEAPDSVQLLADQADVKTVVQATTDYYRLDLNATSSVLQDDRLREAIALAVDRDKIRDVALVGVGEATAAVAPAFEGVCESAEMPHALSDPARARALVQAAGAEGETVEILTPSAVPMAAAIAQVIQQDVEATGLNVEIASVEIGDLYERAYTGERADFDIIVSWFGGGADPARVLALYDPATAGFNKAWTKPDPDLAALIQKSLSIPQGPDRTTAIREACLRIAQAANIIPLVTKESIVAYRQDTVDPSIPSVEAHSLPLRNLAEFGLK